MTYVKISASGQRGTGKTTLLEIARKALIEAGYNVGPINVQGEEVITESFLVPTQTTEVIWLNKQQKK